MDDDRINESVVENAFIESFENIGYDYLYGPEIERSNDYSEVILKEDFYNSMRNINDDITDDIIDEVYRKIRSFVSVDLIQCNQEFHKFVKEGVAIPLPDNKTYTVKLIDFENCNNNHFCVVNQYTIEEYKVKRPDMILFINGLPFVVFEFKNAVKENTTIENAYNQIENYKMDIKSLFYYNAFNVISDGFECRVGTITADYTRYMIWKSANGESPEENINQMETLINGVFIKERLLDIINNFIMFQTKDGKVAKILSGYHQYFAVKKSVNSTIEAIDKKTRKAGVVFHTQGSGKSFAMVFYTGILLKKPELNNPTIVVLTDRNDLDNQLYTTFANADKQLIPQEPKQASNREELKGLLSVKAGGVIFTTIQKFEEDENALTDRENVIFIVDEAHRSQYGLTEKLDYKTGDIKSGYAKTMRDSAPNATFIAFTGTPIELKDKNTRELFGEYIDIYDMTQAIDDNATVPIYYENRVASLNLDDATLIKLDKEYETVLEDGEATEEVVEKSKQELGRLESVLGSKKRLEMLSKDIVEHYELRKDILTGKAMIVCMNRKIAIDLYNEIIKLKPEYAEIIGVVLTDNNNDPVEWHDIVGNKAHREALAVEFKNDNSKMKIAIVVDMWLTGFDVPSLATMYIDKPLKGHGLMQTIARVNRVYKDKEAGLIVDYIGIGHELKEAINQYTKRDHDKIPDVEIAKQVLLEKLEIMRDYFYGFDYLAFFGQSNQERLNVLVNGVNFILNNDKEYIKEFLNEATALGQADTLARTRVDDKTKLEVEFFKGIKVGVAKTMYNDNSDKPPLTTTELNSRIVKILDAAFQDKGVIDLFKEANKDHPRIDILSEDYIKKLKESDQKNIIANLLTKLLENNIKFFRRTNLVKSQAFSEKLRNLLNQYNNRLIDSATIIEELLNLSSDITAAYNEGNEKGLTHDEIAFYDALANDPEVLREMKDEVLIQLAQELTESVRKNRTVDWDKKASARAFMRKEIKRLLRKYHYPPNQAEKAVETVVKQAELMSREFVA